MNKGYDEKIKSAASTASTVHKYEEKDCKIGEVYYNLTMDIWDTPGGDHFTKINTFDY